MESSQHPAAPLSHFLKILLIFFFVVVLNGHEQAMNKKKRTTEWVIKFKGWGG